MQVPLVFMGYKKQAQDNTLFTETSESIDFPKTSFASQLVSQWKRQQKGFAMGMPVTLMRFGVVLKRGKGMLKITDSYSVWNGCSNRHWRATLGLD